MRVIYDRQRQWDISIGVTACMKILWWRFLVRLAGDMSDGMHSELGNQVKLIRCSVPSFTYDITWRTENNRIAPRIVLLLPFISQF